jgi:pectinesterase
MKITPLAVVCMSALFWPAFLPAQLTSPPLAMVSLLPENRATNVCPDTHLVITFDQAPIIGNSGQVRIYDAADHRLVDTIDVGVPATSQNYIIGGANNFHLYPILASGNSAIIYPHHHVLDYGKTYDVQVDAGVLQVDEQSFPGLSGNQDWVFSTKAAPPAKDAIQLVVAADGTGDFATVQGAVDFVPDQPAQRVTIFIRKGLYPEIVYFDHKANITFLGEDRTRTVIGYPNNDKFNNQANTTERPTTTAYHRAAFFANHSTGIDFVNLTLKNSTPKGGSQAEALILAGGQNILSHCNLSSLQDTLQINDSAYVTDCFIEGDVDFMWGRGPAFFENCELKSLNRGYYTQIRNTDANHGFVFDKCRFTTAPGVTGMMLARIDPVGQPPARRGYPYSEVVLLDCALGPQFSPKAWQLDGGATTAPNVHFWEFNSVNLADGQPADTSMRPAYTKQLTMEKDADTIKNYRDPAYVLGWKPELPSTTAAP